MTSRYRSDYIVKKMYSSFVMVSILSAIAATTGMLIDNIIAGQFLGQDALGAMGIVGPVSLVFSAIGNICSGGGTALASQAVGRGDKRQVRNIFTITILFAVISGLIVTIPGILFPRQIAELLGAKDVLVDLAEDYIRGFFIGTIPTILTTALMGFVKIDGSPRLPLYSIIVMSVGDVVLDLLMVIVFKQGMFGMALATTISYTLAVAVACVHFFTKKNTLKFVKPNKPWKQLGAMIATGAPTAVSRVCDTLKSVILNIMLISAVGVGAIAALNVRNQANNILGALTLGIGQAIIPVAGMFYGEEDKTALRATLKSSIRIGLILNCIAAVILAAFPNVLPTILGVQDGEIMTMAAAAIIFFAASMPLRVLNNIFLNFYQTTKKVGMALVICIFESVVYTVAAAFILIKPMGSSGVWLAFILAEALTLITLYAVVAVRRKKLLLGFDDFMLLSKSFGAEERDKLEFSIGNSMDEVMKASEKFYEFSKTRSKDKNAVQNIALCIEEIAGNIVTHAFKKGDKRWLDVTIMNKKDSILLQFRDNGLEFDPVNYAYLLTDDQKEENLGIRLIQGMTDGFVYRRSMGLNVLQITLKNPTYTSAD